MKFSVASFFTLVTLLCHALAASVQYVRLLSSSANLGIKLTTYIFRRWARCRSILIYGQETTLAQLLPFAYTQGLEMWAHLDLFAATIILKYSLGPDGLTCCGPLVDGAGT